MNHLTDMQNGLLAASAGGVGVFLVVASVLTGRSPHPAVDAPPAAVEPEPLVWLACHNIACAAHMHTRHIPHDDGTATCQTCGQIRRDHQ